MFEVDKIKALIMQGEGLNIEFKKSHDALSRSAFETICAFLNRKGGYILLGVKDDGKVEGIKEDTLPMQLKTLASDMTNPQIISPVIRLDTEVVEIEGKKIICIYVPESEQVHSYKGTYYDRQNEVDIKLVTYPQISALYIRKQVGYTENRIYPYMRMEDFVQEDIEAAKREAILRNANHAWKNMSNEEVLRSLKMYLRNEQTGEEGYTMAAALVFGKEETIYSVCPHYKIDALLRKDNVDRYDDRDIMTCNLFEAYFRLLAFINKHTPDRFYLEGYTRLSIRELIFREMVANFLAHREYSNPYPARITIYKDTVVSENWTIPKTIGLITPENVIPHPKNPAIDNCFRQMGWVEDLGSGIRNLYKYCPIYVHGSFPVMEENDVFKLIIRYEREGMSSEKIKVAESIKHANKILELIAENPKVTAMEIGNVLSLSERQVRTILTRLVNSNIIERNGSDKSGEWHLSKITG
jgi:ATP-dependent DNA helicase RecG